MEPSHWMGLVASPLGVNMNSRTLLCSAALLSICGLFGGAPRASADSSHARIVRLSLVQGEVRFARETHGDPLADARAGWDAAQLNLPISKGNVLATDSGRAAVEFENGTMAFLSENTVLEFYDLSLEDGSRNTRLVLVQGSAAFLVNPSGDEYFSVTGGDFTVEASTHASFRMNTFDDGSNVAVRTGRVTVLHKKESTSLSKGMSLSMKAGDDASLSTRNATTQDNFDKWVANRAEAITAATNASQKYTSSSAYVPGYADLYTYGAWSSCGGNGFGWRPFGAGYSWSPFAGGSWYQDPAFGWTYISTQPWGWAPYHYGGWLFDTSCGGWFYSPGAYGYGYPGNYGPGSTGKTNKKYPPRVNPPRSPVPVYHASTATFVRQGGKIGVVPMHPFDEKGKTPLNLEHGVLAASEVKGLAAPLTSLDRGQKFETLKAAPREAFNGGGLARTSAPSRVASSILEGSAGRRALVLGKDNLMAFDASQHRFVTANTAAVAGRTASGPQGMNGHPTSGLVARSSMQTSTSARVSTPSASGRGSSAPSRSYSPPASRGSGGSYGGAASSANSGRGSSGGGGGASASSGSGSRSSTPSSSTSSGGRAH